MRLAHATIFIKINYESDARYRAHGPLRPLGQLSPALALMPLHGPAARTERRGNPQHALFAARALVVTTVARLLR